MKDQEHIQILRKYFRENKFIPSFEEVAKLLGFRSKGSVANLFHRLIDEEYFTKQGHSFIPQDKFFTQKVYDSVKAGFPSPGDEENSHNIDLDTYLIPRPESTLMITVQGDSMIEAGIHPGDIVIVDKGVTAKAEDIVIAEIDREYTLKYLKKDKDGYFLRAGNTRYPDFYPREELRIFGTVIGVIRKYSK